MAEEPSTGRALAIVVAAIAIVCAAIGAYVYINKTVPASSGQVLSLDVYPIHRDMSTPGGTDGLAGQAEIYDEMLVFANVRVKNLSKGPLYLQDFAANAELADSEQHTTAVSPADFEKVFIAYPAARKFRKPAMPRDLTISPGNQQDGLMIFHYEIPKAQWDARKALNIIVSYKNQNDLTIAAPSTPAQ